MSISWKNALAGGTSGATAGMEAGPYGAAAGGVLGFLGGLFSGDDPNKTLDRFPPEIQQLIMQRAQSSLQGNPSGFAPIEQQARQQFQTQTVPSLAERFTAMGGGQNSSAFQGALGAHSAQLETGLAALKSQFGQQDLQSLLPLLEQNYERRQPGFGENAIAGATQSLPAILQYLSMKNGEGMSSSPMGQPTMNKSAFPGIGTPLNLAKPQPFGYLGGGNKYGSF
jgi:hypothetical protein